LARNEAVSYPALFNQYEQLSKNEVVVSTPEYHPGGLDIESQSLKNLTFLGEIFQIQTQTMNG